MILNRILSKNVRFNLINIINYLLMWCSMNFCSLAVCLAHSNRSGNWDNLQPLLPHSQASKHPLADMTLIADTSFSLSALMSVKTKQRACIRVWTVLNIGRMSRRASINIIIFGSKRVSTIPLILMQSSPGLAFEMIKSRLSTSG